MLANLTLDGLERELTAKFAPTNTRASRHQVHLIRYADDFLITGRTKELLEEEVNPVGEGFQAARPGTLTEQGAGDADRGGL